MRLEGDDSRDRVAAKKVIQIAKPGLCGLQEIAEQTKPQLAPGVCSLHVRKLSLRTGGDAGARTQDVYFFDLIWERISPKEGVRGGEGGSGVKGH